MAEILEMYNNGTRLIIEDGAFPIQLIFKNERNEITGYALVSINRLKKIIFNGGNDLSWYKATF